MHDTNSLQYMYGYPQFNASASALAAWQNCARAQSLAASAVPSRISRAAGQQSGQHEHAELG